MTVTIPLALLAGIVAFVSPCFLPIVPVFLAYLVGGAPQLADGFAHLLREFEARQITKEK